MKAITNINFVKKSILLACILFSSVALVAQEEDEESKLKITGSVDAYYRTNLSSTDDAILGAVQAPSTSFATETGFALGFANLIASYEGEKTGAVADLVYGPRGLQAAGVDTGIFINQLYAYWNVGEGTTLTMGRFNTYLGYEVIAPAANFNYSTSYLFSNGPFSHVGLKADFALSDDFSLMVAVMNVTDTNQNLTGTYSAGAQLGYSDQYLNFYYDGGEVLGFEVDYTGGLDLSEDFFLGVNAAYTSNDGTGFYGAALYPQLATSDSFSLGLRGEFFATYDDIDATDDDSVFAVTLTGSYSVENLIIKPELRLDSGNTEIFLDNDLNPSKSLSSFLLAAIYSF